MTPRPVRTGRRRAWLLGCAAGVLATGLLVHVIGSGPAGDFTADALYAVLIYLLVALLLPRASSVTVAGIALAFCGAIELFQLTGVPGILSDAFPPARLVFGTTFAPVDLIAYALGTGVALAADAAVRRSKTNRVKSSESEPVR
ncbi:DUF2809 domain-containing protein [Leifsonia sp. YAF41]|uniref:ribosomal maturation YjgA family protein n=1 Tax=Leifsonia sp. YAF41 TaxID=3233086 RepID=UPI003F9BB42B